MEKQKGFLDQVRQAVEESGYGRNQLARMVGMDKSSMSRFMSGERGLSAGAIDTLAAVLKLRVTWDRQAGGRHHGES